LRVKNMQIDLCYKPLSADTMCARQGCPATIATLVNVLNIDRNAPSQTDIVPTFGGAQLPWVFYH
jgi:hypothetical protein